MSQFWSRYSLFSNKWDKLQLNFRRMAVFRVEGVHVEREKNHTVIMANELFECTSFSQRIISSMLARFEKSQINVNNINKQYPINVVLPFSAIVVLLAQNSNFAARFCLKRCWKLLHRKIDQFSTRCQVMETKLGTHSLKVGVLFIHRKLCAEDRKNVFSETCK